MLDSTLPTKPRPHFMYRCKKKSALKNLAEVPFMGLCYVLKQQRPVMGFEGIGELGKMFMSLKTLKVE